MPLYKSSEFVSVAAAAAAFATALVPGTTYLLSANTDLWFRIGTDPTAGANSHFVKAGDARIITHGLANQTLRVIRDAVDGKASLSIVELP